MKVKEKIKALIFSGYGLNCEEETAYGFTLAGAQADIVHINDVIDGCVKLKDYHILAFPGGFSYGDDTGSGKAYANRVLNYLGNDLKEFLKRDTLILGICNGFQILTQIGLLPGALTYNDSNRYLDRWVDLEAEGTSPWLAGIKEISLPIAHGEGKYIANKKTLDMLRKKGRVAFRYAVGETSTYQGLPGNPNGAMEHIAGVLSHEGRVLGMMPHPDRHLFFHQRPDWPLLKEQAKASATLLPEPGAGLQIFENGVRYFTR
jgi:phosphoribosylformylglycinamidine synthase